MGKKDKMVQIRIENDVYEKFKYVCDCMDTVPSTKIRQLIKGYINDYKSLVKSGFMDKVL